jgi:neutral ceramidase
VKRYTLLILVLSAGMLGGADFKAGFGQRRITPPMPIWLAGFAARTHPSDSVAHDIYTKALALQDAGGRKLIVMNVELATMPKAMTDVVAGRIMHKHSIDRSRLLINLTHTHSGPALDWPAKADREMLHRIEAYRIKVMDSMAEAADAAVADLAPARISYGAGKVGFSHNRRERVPGGGFRFGMDPDGPVDQTVPVLRISGTNGRLRGVLFGLSCHPSALTPTSYVLSGDYSGIAQIALEKAHPGATALFIQLAGGDQTTYPRGTMELCEKYGRELSAEVNRVMAAAMKPVRAPITTAMLSTELAFAPFSLELFEKQANDPDSLIRTHAERMLKMYAAGQPPMPFLPYTMQAIQFGRDLTLLAMNGEVVADYSLRVKKEYGAEGMIVAGYSNDRPCYIPSARILGEGGYEARDSILMVSLPGPLDKSVEETIFAGIRELMRAVGRAPM